MSWDRQHSVPVRCTAPHVAGIRGDPLVETVVQRPLWHCQSAAELLCCHSAACDGLLSSCTNKRKDPVFSYFILIHTRELVRCATPLQQRTHVSLVCQMVWLVSCSINKQAIKHKDRP